MHKKIKKVLASAALGGALSVGAVTGGTALVVAGPTVAAEARPMPIQNTFYIIAGRTTGQWQFKGFSGGDLVATGPKRWFHSQAVADGEAWKKGL